MKEIIKNIAAELKEPEAKINVALSRLNMLTKTAGATLHWEKTELGERYINNESIHALIALIKEQIDSMADGPDLGVYSFPSKKKCSNCGKHRTNQYFGVSDKTDDGLTKWCLPCLMHHNQQQHYGRV